MRLFAFLLPALLSVSLTAQTISGFSPLVDVIRPDPTGIWPSTEMAVDPTGDVYLVNWITTDVAGANKIGTGFGTGDILIVKTDARMEQVRFTTVIGAGTGTGAGVRVARVDAGGYLYLLGGASSDDFPFTNRLTSATKSTFLLKLSPSGDQLVYATQLENFLPPFTLDIDATGAAYIGARSGSDRFVMKLNATGDTVLYQKTVGGELDDIVGLASMPDGKTAFLTHSTLGALNAAGSALEFAVPMSAAENGITRAQSLGKDAAGNLYVNGSVNEDGDVVAKFSPMGGLLGVRHLPGAPGALSFTTMSVSANGNVYLTAKWSGASLPTRNALELCISNVKPPYGFAGLNPEVAFGSALVVYGADGALLYSSPFTSDPSATVLSNDGRYLYVYGPQHRYGSSPMPDWNGVQRLDLSRIPKTDRVSPSCLAHGASYVPAATSPGAIMTIYGSNLGPQTGASFTLVNGIVPAELEGTSVTVDGLPAPLLYAQSSQINFIAPWATRTQGTVEVCVIRAGERRCWDTSAGVMAPAAFIYQSSAIVVHQDGALNSQANPAPRGSYVSLYLTGTGALSGPLADGAVWDLSLQHLTAGVTAWVVGDTPPCPVPLSCPQPPPAPTFPVDVVYAGSAPFLVQGASQMNIHILQSVPTGSRRMVLQFAGPSGLVKTETVTIWIAP